MAIERMARFQRDADRYRQAREARSARPNTVKAAILLRLRASRQELDGLARGHRAAGHMTK